MAEPLFLKISERYYNPRGIREKNRSALEELAFAKLTFFLIFYTI